MLEKLKPCPFCGGKATTSEIHEDNGMPEIYYREYNYYIVECKKCGVSLVNCYDMDRAIKTWNRRAAVNER